MQEQVVSSLDFSSTKRVSFRFFFFLGNKRERNDNESPASSIDLNVRFACTSRIPIYKLFLCVTRCTRVYEGREGET